MILFELLFWILLFFIFYSYLGYPLLSLLIATIKKPGPVEPISPNYEPRVTLFVAAYNEQDFVDAKIANSLELDYPEHKLELVWVTDGSNDRTNEELKKYPGVKVYYEPERRGKINAMNRGMDFVNSEIVVFSDGNTLVSKEAIKEMVKGFNDARVGCIAGEKRIELSQKDTAATAGEGFYWKYESWVKQLDAKTGSCIGAAGELFAIRRNLFVKVAPDTILDDFIISLSIAMKGFKVGYAPMAYALEKASANIAEEMKRKVRIAAGSIQTLIRLKNLLNMGKYGYLSFQYFSHKVMRWIVTPLSLLLLIPLNIMLAVNANANGYKYILGLHLLFYLLVFLGWLFKDKKMKVALLFIPYYFFMANLAMFLGFGRNIKGSQSVNWERAKRSV